MNNGYEENNTNNTGAENTASDIPAEEKVEKTENEKTKTEPKSGEATWESGEYSFKPSREQFDKVPESVRTHAEAAQKENQHQQNPYQQEQYQQNQYQQNQQTPYQSNFGFNYETPYNQPHKPKKPKAPKAKLSVTTVALLVVLCIVVSGAAGVGGAYIGNKVYGNSGTTTIYKTISDEKNLGTTDFAISNVVEAVENSVVEIVTEKIQTSAYYGQYVSTGAGSGVIISDDGYLATCAHVVDGASTVTVQLKDGTKFDAKIIGSDSKTDVALIKIEPGDKTLTPAVIGDSSSLIVGEPAIAIGNPLGELGGTVTNGIISALEREVEIDGTTYTLLQTNAAINPGNSGGALFDIDGNLIGIVNAKEAGTELEGLGFAIPINTAIDIISQLKDKGYVSGRPQLGIHVYDVSSQEAYSSLSSSSYSQLKNYVTDYGVYFIKYQDGVTGDLKFGDRILAIDGISTSSSSDLKSILDAYEVGDTVKVTVARLNENSRFGRTVSEMVDVEVTLIESNPDNQ